MGFLSYKLIQALKRTLFPDNVERFILETSGLIILFFIVFLKVL